MSYVLTSWHTKRHLISGTASSPLLQLTQRVPTTRWPTAALLGTTSQTPFFLKYDNSSALAFATSVGSNVAPLYSSRSTFPSITAPSAASPAEILSASSATLKAKSTDPDAATPDAKHGTSKCVSQHVASGRTL